MSKVSSIIVSALLLSIAAPKRSQVKIVSNAEGGDDNNDGPRCGRSVQRNWGRSVNEETGLK